MRVIEFVFVASIYVMLYGVLVESPTPLSIDSVPRTRAVFIAEARQADDLTDCAETTRDVYNNLLFLLARKMRVWLRGRPHNLLKPFGAIAKISNYLGFPDRTVDLINTAMTLLLGQQLPQDGRIRVDNLAEAYFYCCDLENMIDPYSILVMIFGNVEKNFKQLLANLGIDTSAAAAADGSREQDELQQLAERLEKSLRNSIPEDGVKDFYVHSVTVGLMKNAVFVAADLQSDAVNDLMRQRLMEYRRDDAVSYEPETNFRKIVKNHVTFLGKLIPDVFGYVYNHVELVLELRKSGDDRGLDETAEVRAAVAGLSDFLPTFQSIFLERYFYFGRRPFDSALTGALGSLTDFMTVKGNAENGKISIADFRTDDAGYERGVWKLVDDFLLKLLPLFGLDEVDEWKTTRPLRVDCEHKTFDKSELLRLIERNTHDAFAVLNLYASYFVPMETIKTVAA